MRIQIKLFAMLRDAAGAAEAAIELPPGATVGCVREPLLEQFPALRAHLSRVAYAVNRDYASSETPLQDGDEVALIPPVSGG